MTRSGSCFYVCHSEQSEESPYFFLLLFVLSRTHQKLVQRKPLFIRELLRQDAHSKENP